MTPGGRRLLAMVRKEWLQVLRDPSGMGVAFVLPVVLLFLFGYGVSLDARDIPVAVVIEQSDAATTSLFGAFRRSEYFRPRAFQGIQQGEAALSRHEVDAIIWLRADFARRLMGGDEAPIAVRINGVNANQGRMTEDYIQGVWLAWLRDWLDRQGRPLPGIVRLDQRVWFNTAMISRHYIVPGLLAVIMTLIGSLLTSLVIARERERGTMESLLVTPLRMNELLLGKLIPYFLLGMTGMLLTVVLARWQFHVPLRGSFWLLCACSALFMLVTLGMGLTISVIARSQFIAGQIAIVSTFLPAFILSGFIFDIDSMPSIIQGVTYLVPARYYVAILQSLFLAGDVWPVVIANAVPLVIMAVLFLGIVRRRLRRRLE